MRSKKNNWVENRGQGEGLNRYPMVTVHGGERAPETKEKKKGTIMSN